MSDLLDKESVEKTLVDHEETWRLQIKNVFLAGLGAVAMAEEEMQKFLAILVQKGSVAENDLRKWTKEFMEKHYRQTKETVTSIENSLEKAGTQNLDSILSKLNVPLKAQFDDLAQKVEKLAARIEDLSKKLPQ